MTRRHAWIALGVAVVAALGAAVFLTMFERVPITRRESASQEARRNPYLALERFLGRMGHTATRTADPEALRDLPLPGALLLDRNRVSQLTDSRRRAVLDWVSRGGYLLLVPEAVGTRDALAEHFDLTWLRQDGADDAAEQDEASQADDDGDGLGPRRPPLPPLPTPLPVAVPGTNRTLSVAVRDGLRVGNRPPLWSATHPDRGVQVVHFDQGRGAVTVVANLDQLLSNDAIGDHDHAELVLALLRQYQPDGTLLLLTQLDTQSLAGWLVDRAPYPLASAAVALALWLWHVVPRFGAVVPDPPRARRELRDHLLAVGRFVHAQDGGHAWVTAARAAVEGAVARRHPGFAVGTMRVEQDATRLGVAASDLADAFGTSHFKGDGFATTMRALQRVERGS